MRGGGGGDGLVKVAYGADQMEAEMIQGLLSDHGIQSMLKRGPGFDVPSPGRRSAPGLRAESTAELAREVLEGTPGVS